MPHTLDVGLDDFEQVVIAGSHERPVIVDFWAPWCGPCKTLGPILEKLADEYGGRFLLAKVNSDENQPLAQRWGVRGIPAVKAFIGGQAVDEFTGALPEGAVREFIDSLLPSPADPLRAEAFELADAGRFQEALAKLVDASRADPANEGVRIDAAEVLLALDRPDEAKEMLDSLGASPRDPERVQALRAKLALAGNAALDPAEFERRIAADPGDLEARLELAKTLAAVRRYADALEQLLEIVRRDRSFGDDAGRKTILQIFEVLGGDPAFVALVRSYRARLAGLINR